MICLDADISSGMILQRDERVPVTGKAAAGADVCVSAKRGGKTLSQGRAQADESGRFTVLLGPVSGSCEACEVIVTSGDETVTLTDVLFGDVFHIMGQSNMELPLYRVYDPYDAAKPFSGVRRTPDCPYVREFRAPVIPCFDPEEEYDCWEQGEWSSSDSPKAVNMSAVGYFFARALFDRFGIPIGLLNTSAGGAPIEAFLPYEELRGLHCCDAFLDEAAAPGWMERTAAEDGKRCQEYYSMLEREDRLGPQVLSGNCPAGEEISLPFWIKGVSGRLWFWREFDLPEGSSTEEAQLLLGTLTDSDAAYINGVKVGETGYMYPPRYYSIPSGAMHPGRNRLAVRLDIHGSEGGFTPGKRWCLKSGDSLIDLSRGWHYAAAVKTEGLKAPVFFQGLPLSMYAVSAPAYRRRFKGLVIYQGESNGSNAERYKELFSHFIGYYRRRIGWEIPVIFTQLPEYGSQGSWPVIRQAQLDCTALPGTAMAVTVGTGEVNDLHPINKWDVGRRLARQAMKLIYEGREERPVYCIEARCEGRRVILSFSGELCLSRQEDSYFTAVCADGEEKVRAEQLSGRSIALVLTREHPAEIRYAWMQSPVSPQLFDRDGMPVSPFRIPVDEV